MFNARGSDALTIRHYEQEVIYQLREIEAEGAKTFPALVDWPFYCWLLRCANAHIKEKQGDGG